MLEFLRSNGLFAAGIAAATLLYLLIDFFAVVKNFASILKAPSFWFFWFLISVLNFLAFKALNGPSSSLGEQFGNARELALIVFSTLGTVAILQSFALKIGDRKIVDVSTVIENFRATVLEDISRRAASSQREFTSRTANRLFDAFKGKPAEPALRNEFVRVMTFGDRNAGQVKEELAQISVEADTLQVPLAMLLAQRIAKADVGEAGRLAREAGRLLDQRTDMPAGTNSIG